MTLKLRDIIYAFSLAMTGTLAATCGAAAQAQAPAAAPGPTAATLPGTPTGEQIQPWGLPPPPSGIGPVSLFADIHDTPQGKFLEGGAFDDAGNFWFVAIGSGWISGLAMVAIA